MSNALKELFEKAKQIFAGEEPAPTPAPAEPAKMEAKSYKLKSGVEVSIAQAGETIAIGDTVTVDGAPAPEGEHELEDGTKFKVDAAGLITEVEAPEVKPVTTPEPAPVQTPTQMAAITAEEAQKLMDSFATGTPEERIAKLEIVCKALMDSCMGWEIREAQSKKDREAALAVYNEGLVTAQTTMAKQEKTIQALFEVIEEVVKVPTEEPKTLTSNRKDRFEQLSEKKEKKFEAIAAGLKAMKQKAQA